MCILVWFGLVRFVDWFAALLLINETENLVACVDFGHGGGVDAKIVEGKKEPHHRSEDEDGGRAVDVPKTR